VALIDSIVSSKEDVVDDFDPWLLIDPAGVGGASGSGPEHGCVTTSRGLSDPGPRDCVHNVV
jgi:hypothetical protein